MPCNFEAQRMRRRMRRSLLKVRETKRMQWLMMKKLMHFRRTTSRWLSTINSF